MLAKLERGPVTLRDGSSHVAGLLRTGKVRMDAHL